MQCATYFGGDCQISRNYTCEKKGKLLIILTAGETHNNLSAALNGRTLTADSYVSNESDHSKYAGMKIYTIDVNENDYITVSCTGYGGYESGGDRYTHASLLISYIS